MEDKDIRAGRSKNYVVDLFFGTAEKTFEESAFVDKSQFKPFNPDDLYQKAGDHSIYEEMLNDDQVSVALQLKKDLVIGAGFDIVEQDDNQDEIVDDLNRALFNDVCPSFQELLEEILSAYEFGFSLSEKIFKTRDDGSLTLNTIKTRHPDTWLIHTDPHGNIEKFEQHGLITSVDIDPKSMIHYVNNRKFQNAFGKSDLRAAYQAYFTKRHIIRFYSIYLEKAASPTPIAKFDKNIPDSTVTKIFNIIKRFQARTAMTIPKDVDIEFLECKSNGEAFIKGINLFNMFIGRALTVPDLIGFQGSDTAGGSQSLSKEQMKIFINHIKRRRSILEETVNRHIINPIVKFNFGDVQSPPIFQLRPISDDEAIEFAKTFLTAVTAKAYKPNEEEINHFRSLIKFPEGEVNEVEIPPSFGRPRFGGGNDDPNKDGKGPDNDPNKNNNNNPELELDDTKETEKENFTHITERTDGGFKETPGDFKDKVDFDSVESAMKNTVNKINQETNPLVDDLFSKLIDDVQKKKILEKQNTDLVDTIKLKNLNAIQRILNDNFRRLFSEAQKIANNEIFNTKEFATEIEPLLTKEFLAFLNKETFDAIGDWQFKIKGGLKQRLRQAIKDGEPLSNIITELEGMFIEQQKVAIERFARTKTTEVMNRGRVAVFKESDIVDGFQFSAILDGSTTVICAGLHGKQFAKGDEPIPPLHFNCRSLLIPITKFEKLEPDATAGGGTVETRRTGPIKVGPKKPIEQFIKDNLGTGFSKK